MARPLRLRTSGASENFDTGGYAYDGAGNVTEMGDDRYVYDLLSRIGEAQIEVPGTGCGEELLLDSGTDFGTITHESCGTVRAEGSYRVGAGGDVTLQAGHRVVLGDGFSVAVAGRLTVLTDPALDPEGGATEVAQSYTYDRFGNLTEITTEREGESPETRTIGTNSSTNRLTVAGYDLSGNVTSWAGREYRYDPFNMLWQTKPTGGNGVSFVYGPGDERLWTIDWSAGSAPSNWLETWTLRDLDGSVLRQFRNDGGNDDRDKWKFQRDYVYRGGALLAAHSPEGLHHFHLDHLGSPRIITDSNATTLAQHLYFPFGEEATNPTQDDEALKFTGHERNDLDPGGTTADVDYMHARYFSAHLGRFLSLDPKSLYSAARTPGIWNRYAYVAGNPLKFLDQDGREISLASQGNAAEVKMILVEITRRPSGRSQLSSLAARTDFVVTFRDHDFKQNVTAVQNLQTQGSGRFLFGETARVETQTPMGSTTTGAEVRIDTGVLQYHPSDKTGVATGSHEIYHAADIASGMTNEEVAKGDMPSNASGPASAFGLVVVNEPPDLTLEEANKLLDEWLGFQPAPP